MFTTKCGSVPGVNTPNEITLGACKSIGHTTDTSNDRYFPTSNGNQPLTYSVFNSTTAIKRVERIESNWDDFVATMKSPKSFKRKASQPLLKLAEFGDKRNASGSLRHDANVLMLHGVEGDYDGEKVTPEEAAHRLRVAGIKAVIYTSASHGVVNPPASNGGPRWRVLAPFSMPLPPKQRRHYVSLLNRALGGILAPESWTLNQTYYYGKVNGVAYEVIEVNGDCLDVVDLWSVIVPLDSPVVANALVTLEKHRRPEDVNDPAVAFLEANDWIKRFADDGKIYVSCPWGASHTSDDNGPSSTVYFPIGLGGRSDPGFKCMHSHCVGRCATDFLREIGFQDVSSEFQTLPHNGQLLPAYDRDNQGKIYPTRNNLEAALMRSDLCGLEIRRDTFHECAMVAPNGTDAWRPMADSDYTDLCKRLEKGSNGFKPIPRDLIREMVHNIAEHNRFDSAKHWLESLQWDGVQRVETFLSDYLNVGDTPYSRAVCAYMWTALAGRVISQGVKADMVPVLVGDQGTGKSSVVAAMAPSEKEFLELDLAKHDDDQAREMRGKLVIELGEMRGLRKKEQAALKSFIARRYDTWVPKYMECSIQYARRSLFIGTTNVKEFLVDDTGHRRWLPIDVPGHTTVGARNAALEALVRSRDQLWAEAAVLFKKAGIAWQKAETLASHEHEKFEVIDPWEQKISEWLDTAQDFGMALNSASPFTIDDVLIAVIKVPLERISSPQRSRVASLLRRLGYYDGGGNRRKLNGKRAVWWELRPDPCALKLGCEH